MKWWGNHLQLCSVSKPLLVFMFKVSWQCLFQLNGQSSNRMVFHDLQLSTFVPQTCSTLRVVASGLITPRGRQSWANNLFLENWSQPNNLSLLLIVSLCKNVFLWKRKMVCNDLFVWLLIPSQDSWLKDSGFRKRAIKYSLMTRKFIRWYIRYNKNHNSEGPPPCTFKRSGVSVPPCPYPRLSKLMRFFLLLLFKPFFVFFFFSLL